MVCFECQKCNETVKKPKLEKHLLFCGSWYVSCIDCSKVFGRYEWQDHISCVSEAQKYQGNLYQAKESTNKNAKKQDAWTESVERCIEDSSSNISPQLRQNLKKLLGFSNIPRKQKPFANFVKNSLNMWDDRKIQEIWDVISSVTSKAKVNGSAPPVNGNAPPANGNTPAVNGNTAAVNSDATAAKGDALVVNGSSPKLNSEADRAEAKANGAATAVVQTTDCAVQQRWGGWKRALDEELSASGGQLPWKRLRDVVVERCCKCGGAQSASREELRYQALAAIPESYLSKEDELVRLPP